MPPKVRTKKPPKGRGRATPHIQRGVVKLKHNSRYRIEEPLHPLPKWVRDDSGRLVSNLPRRPNVGGLGTVEVYYHVNRENPDEVLPPPKTLWRQRDVSLGSSEGGDLEGNVGVPYLYTYDEKVEPDEEGLQYRRWRPLKILANGGYGVVITYVDDARGFTVDADIANEDIVVAKFNYKGGDLVDIMASVVNEITMSEEIRRAHLEDDEGKSHSNRTNNGTESSSEKSKERGNSHEREYKEEEPILEPITPSAGLDLDTTDTFRQETEILEILDMTGSPHFPKFWKLADPPQDGTICTMDYNQGGVTLDQQLNTLANEKVPIRLLWEAVLCLSKAMSVMAYGSEDPAPTHRVHGWNQIVHLDWSEANIFTQVKESISRRAFETGLAQNLNPQLPEANIDTEKSFEERVKTPIIGHFSHETNIFLMAEVWRDNLGGNKVGRLGIMRYMQDNLTPIEQIKLEQNLYSHLSPDERLGRPLVEGHDCDDDVSDDDDSDNADNYAPRVRGYVDVAETLLAQNVAQSLRVSEQRFVNLMTRCLKHDPAERPEIEEIMLQAARGMAEAGVYVPPTPSSSENEDSEDGEDEE
ncbi:hypothetical protein LA080_013177 [Diaporthe eres]|nr:hypothetical protein LA080_013177 [Diaporthe eres]